MLTKILTGGFILIMIGAVVAGAIAILGPSNEAHANAEARGRATGLGLGTQAETFSEGRGQGAGGQRQGQGQGMGRGQTQVLEQGQGLGRAEGFESDTAPQELETFEGRVVETDELVIETPAVGADPTADAGRGIMEGVVELAVPLRVDVGIGTTLGDAKAG